MASFSPLRTVRAAAFAVSLLVLLAVPAPPAAAQQADRDAAVDEVFARYDTDEFPGCTVAASEDRAITLSRAYGLADLEHDVPNTPETVFEAGSVSKQFTAAATVLLALEGKLSLDDDVRTHFPELPDYGESITVRHLLNHTSGLRDWGSVAGIEGWPRTTRIHTHGHALDIMARQTSLNYPPGEYYSYTNSGYNLLAMLVERVSGQSFADFTRERLFEPLGMTRTEWRDDFTRVVEDRATAYRPGGDGFHILMPFENVHGNGGLLTTVGDLLRWTWNLETGEVGGPRFIEEMHRQGVLDSGRTISYASGLMIDEYRGVPEVEHGGATAGYRAFLTRFPEQGVAVAVLCNRGDANAGAFAYGVADVLLGDALAPDEADEDDAPASADPDVVARVEGTYRNTRTNDALRLVADEGRLLWDGRAPLRPVTATSFMLGTSTVEVAPAPAGGGRGAVLLIGSDGDTVRFLPVDAAEPSDADLAAYAGEYRSDEAEVTYWFDAEDGELNIRDRYGRTAPVAHVYEDAFQFRGATLRFVRDASGRVQEMRWSESRVWDLTFERVGSR